MRAESTPTWDPGRRTTNGLRGGALPDDRSSAGDGVYGRFEGDVTFALGIGAELGNGPRAALVTRALYYHTAGLTLGYAESFGTGNELGRALDLGVELRPLFLPRWTLDAEFGCPWVDLTLDSLAVGAGAYWGQWDDQAFAELAGFQAALGLGVPLLGTARGPWLEVRGTYRSLLPGSGLGVSFWLSIYGSWVSPAIR